MNRSAIYAGLAIAGLFLASSKARAASRVTLPPNPVDYPPGYFDAPPQEIAIPEITSATDEFVPLTEAQIAETDYAEMYGGNALTTSELAIGNIAAFLKMLRFSEHTYASVATGADYGTFYGGSTFVNFSDHPVITGEKKGIPLSPASCIRAGFANGKCVSTAAGAYQATVPTWREFREIAPRLPDFSPASQDEFARRLLDRIGALKLLRAGDLKGAVQVASRRWDSLPGSGNPRARSLDFAFAAFKDAGGVA